MYKVDEFVQDSVSLRITPFMLDSYAHEYNDMMKEKEAHALEVEELRNSNRNLSQQMCVSPSVSPSVFFFFPPSCIRFRASLCYFLFGEGGRREASRDGS